MKTYKNVWGYITREIVRCMENRKLWRAIIGVLQRTPEWVSECECCIRWQHIYDSCTINKNGIYIDDIMHWGGAAGCVWEIIEKIIVFQIWMKRGGSLWFSWRKKFFHVAIPDLTIFRKKVHDSSLMVWPAACHQTLIVLEGNLTVLACCSWLDWIITLFC